jgi:putative glycosyl hydrolase-like family 15 (GHL15) protein
VSAARSRRVFILIAALAVLALPGTGRQEAARAADSPQASIASLRICTGCSAAGGNLSRYHYVILNASDAPLLPALKAQNPGLKALVYKNVSFTVSYGCSGGVDLRYQTTGVGYCDANASHPEWFLTDSSGHRLNSSGYSQAWMMDVGNAAYQTKWLSNVRADLQAGAWDGVFMDDTDADMASHLNGRTMARYPTAASWRAATRSMLANVGPSLTSAGFLAVPNLYAPWGSDYDAQATWSDWLQFTSGAAQEYYTKWGSTSSGWFAGNDWTYRQQFQTLTEQAGKIFLGITYAPKSDARTMTWARANFLLLDEPANGGALMYEFSDPEAQDPYSPVWAADVGSPSGARFKVGAAWRRNFSGGTVLVNPSSSSVSVQLERAYLREDGSSTTSVTLGPTSGAILRFSGGSQAPPPPGSPGAPPSSPRISLSASVSGSSVGLSWSGMSSATADVFRNGGKVATVANTGSYRERLSRRARTYTYRVCAAGTTSCSANVSVTVGHERTLVAFLVSPKRRAHLTARHRTRAHRGAPARHYLRIRR